jgi:hypothetical protein
MPKSPSRNTLFRPISSVNLLWNSPFSPPLKVDSHTIGMGSDSSIYMESYIFGSAQESRSSSNWRFSPQSSLRPSSDAFCWTGQHSVSSELKGTRSRLFSPATALDVIFCESNIWGIQTPLSREVTMNEGDSKHFMREHIDMDAFTLTVDDTFTLFEGNGEESCKHLLITSPPPVA